ncbi:MAG: hypothetical protein C0610_17135 [Desulfobacteraceae bacterium]|nr:MAG: hypothetical protein C0610_17135 [Desulfobacteraceae bacterium]
MRSKKGNLTPREQAIVIAMGWIQAAYNGATDDLFESDERDSFRVQVRSALAKEHNRLGARVGSIDIELDAEDMTLPYRSASTDKYLKEDNKAAE